MVCRVEPTGIKTLFTAYKVKGTPRGQAGQRTRLGPWDGELDTLIAAQQRTTELVAKARAGVDSELERSTAKETTRAKDLNWYVERFKDFNHNSRVNHYPILRDELLSRFGKLEPHKLTGTAFRELLWEITEAGKERHAAKLQTATHALYSRIEVASSWAYARIR